MPNFYTRRPQAPQIIINPDSPSRLLDSLNDSPINSNSRSLTNPAGRYGQGHRFFNTTQASPTDDTERLLPPSPTRSKRYADRSPSYSAENSPINSRRSSWSAGSRSSRILDPGTAPSIAGSDGHEDLNTFTVTEKYNVQPSEGLLIFPEDVEKDDYLHNPDLSDKDGRKCADVFSKRGIINLGGLFLILAGVGMLFIGYPVLTFVKKLIYPASNSAYCNSDPMCISVEYPLLKNIRAGPIDPATPKSAYTKTSQSGQTLKLVFSDEFVDAGRTFYPDDDPYFTGVNLWYGATQDLEWYDPDAITTVNGTLVIQFDKFPNHNLDYRSGMLQSWNQVCFKSGHLEASISMPAGDTIGLWPGFWTLGNLARPGYAATSEGMWPYSYDNVCDAGITANQSDPDGYNGLPGMKLPACSCDGEDHPTPGISRSAPEIDVVEGTSIFLKQGNQDAIGLGIQSFQVAPFDRFWRSDANFQTIHDHSVTQLNPYQGAMYQEAISGMTNLNNDWYDGQAYQTYAFEYTPGSSGAINFLIGDTPSWSIDARSIRPNGNVAQRVLPEEPLAMIANLGMAPGFSAINYTGIESLLPARLRIDYIRIYQDDTGELTCDPAGYPTTDYIKNHMVAYTNPNITSWTGANYSWPKNSLVNGCSSSAEPDNSVKRRGAWNCKDGICPG